jgi:phosphatidylinositol alpha-mannosyltransferase
VAAANRVLALLNHTSAKRFDQMVAVSAPARKFARQVYGYDTEVVPNPVSLSQFESATSIDPSLNVVFLGRLVARKGALQLLRAVAYVREHDMFEGSFQVSIGGKGELLPELERFARAHHLEEVVSFHGFVNEAEKAMFLAQADIAVYPSTGGESFGIVLLEAFAAARGVVLAGDNPGYASVMQPYPDQLFDPDDTVAFAEKLAWYLSHPMGRARASEAQHEYVRHFDIGVVGADLVEVYHKALQSRAHS